jgi:sporadic carbohydrate cluster protein (TIGR04323 family)
MDLRMKELARGYIASGQFNGYRAPQHLQNQIVKLYCDINNLEFVLSRAEYWINGNSKCQLWASLEEGFKHIVFFSIWQLPVDIVERQKIFDHCLKERITLHFAQEQMRTGLDKNSYGDLEMLIKTYLMIMKSDNDHLDLLHELL